jgi:putative DNA primase/helicase
MNAVFLSNEIQPFPVEPFDRRMLVIWPEGKLPEDLKNRVVAEMNGEGITAFYHHLLNFDLHGFDAHTQPPMTEAKERLIDFGRPGWDLFYREWERGVFNVPFSSCLLADLYEVYKKWCGEDNERVLSKNRLCQFLVSRPLLKRKADANYNLGTSVKKGTFIVIGKTPEGMKQGVWLGNCVEIFKKAMEVTD